MLDEHDELTEKKNGTSVLQVSSNENSEKRRTFKNILPQILATCAKNLLLLTYGMTLGVSTIALPALDASLQLNTTMEGNKVNLRTDIISLSKSQISWFSSINFMCVPFGCFVSGAITQPFGRKKSMMLLNIPFFTVWLLYYNATQVSTLYVALIISGLAGGLHEAPVITYVAEITEPYLRGMLSATAPTTVIIGAVSQLVMGTFLHWRKVVLINMVFPVIAFTALYFVPESPHWLISKGRYADAEKSLCWLRGWTKPEEVQQELFILKKFIHTKRSATKLSVRETFGNYAARTFVIPYVILMITFFVGQFGGMTSLQTNAVMLFQKLGTTHVNEYTATFIFGLVELLGAIACVILVHVTGKRKLLITTTLACSICLYTLAWYDYLHMFEDSSTTDKSVLENFRWIPIVFLNADAFFTHAGIRLVPWVLVGEVYPTDIRATATGASAMWFYVFAFMVNKSFGWMMDTMGLFGLLTLYASVLLFGSIFFYVFLPETEGLPLYSIEKHFARKGNLLRTRVQPYVDNDEDGMDNRKMVVRISSEKNDCC